METPATILWGEPPDIQGLFDVTERLVALNAAGVLTVAPLDGDRVYLGFFVGSPLFATAHVSIRAGVAIGDAMTPVASAPLEFFFPHHGPLVQQEWFGIATGAMNLTVCEVFYRRRRPIVPASWKNPFRAMNAINTLRHWCGGK